MVIAYLVVGCVIGAVSALIAGLAGAPVWLTVLSYSFGGAAGMLAAALAAHGLLALRDARRRRPKGMGRRTARPALKDDAAWVR
jgi:ribosomal protein S9